ncbi:hypothetical protein ACFC63_03960 [Streptomyces albidoflavus]
MQGELLGLRSKGPGPDAWAAGIRRTLQQTCTDGLTALPAKATSSEPHIAS